MHLKENCSYIGIIMVLNKLSESLKESLRKIARAGYVDKETLENTTKDIQRALLQADVNVSLHGDRIEIKNVNSISSIVRAIDFEAKRQKKEKPLKKETRAWMDTKGETVKMREKEEAADYRFIPEPDLPIINIKEKETNN